MSDLYDVDARDLIDFGNRWAGLGEAVTQQVEELLRNPNSEEVSASAIRRASERLRNLNETLDQVFADFLEGRESTARTVMSPEQVTYLAARAALENINNEVARRSRRAGWDDNDVSDERLDFEAALERELGLDAAERREDAARQALIAWCFQAVITTARRTDPFKVGDLEWLRRRAETSIAAQYQLVELALRLDPRTIVAR